MAENHHHDWKASARVSGLYSRPIKWTAPLLLIFIVIGFHWRLVLTDQFTWLASDDLSAQVLPWFQFQASEWHAGRLPLWDPYSWGGQPLLAQAQPGSANPLNWLVFLAPLKHGWVRQSVLNWHYVLIRVLAALCFYWFCRDLGRSRAAAIIASTVYGVAGYLASVGWPQMVTGAVWAPLVLLFQFRAAQNLKRISNTIFAGFFLGLMWLSGHHQAPIFLSLAAVIFWIYIIFTRPTFKTWIACVATEFGLAFLVGALQILPALEYGRRAVRWVSLPQPIHWGSAVPYVVHEKFAIKPLSLLSFFIPGTDSNMNPMIGILMCSLAGIGLYLGWREPRVRWLAMFALGGVVFALGSDSVFHGIAYATIPLIEKARVPAHALLLFHLGACALAAWGIDLFSTLTRRAAGFVSLGLGTFALFLAATGLVLFLARTLTVNSDTRFMITAFVALVAAILLWAFWNRTLSRATATAGLLGLILLEIGTAAETNFVAYAQTNRTANLRKMAQDADVIDYLRKQPGQPFRIDYDSEAVPHNIGDWWGVETFYSYVASAPDIVWSNDPYSTRMQELLGVQYYFGTKPIRPDQVEVFTAASGRKLFRNPSAFPRTWVVHRVTNSADSGMNFAEEAMVQTSSLPSLQSCSGDTVRIETHLPNEVRLRANMQCRGLIVLSETAFPGWRATVDGTQRPIITTDHFLRGVVADAGNHEIVMRYRPASVLAGAALTGLGTLLALFVAVVRPKW